jgi:16S rRNA (guanine527-N7)-methyltransferase
MKSAGTWLNELLAAAGMAPVDEALAKRFEVYVSLILRWNARINLTAVRDESEIISRHILESIVLARILPDEVHTLLDFGSGAGLPGIPIALCRPEVAVTLAESQGKKAAFLQETARTLGIRVTVHGARAETLTEKFDCVAMRAVDQMAAAVHLAAKLVEDGGWLALMTTRRDLAALKSAAGEGFEWKEPAELPAAVDRITVLGQKT